MVTARRTRLTSRLLAALAVPGGPLALPTPAQADGKADITAAVLASRDIVLAGDSVVNLPAGTTTYNGVISGTGTLTVSGSGTLILTRDNDFTLPEARRRQTVATSPGPHPVTTVGNPDPPAVIVDQGATLQYDVVLSTTGSRGAPQPVGAELPDGADGLPLRWPAVGIAGTALLVALLAGLLIRLRRAGRSGGRRARGRRRAR